MDCIKTLILAALLFAPGFSFAAYTNATPPNGWIKIGPNQYYNAAKAASSTATAFETAGSIYAGGRIANLPATLPYGANAARAAAGFLFKNPLLQGGLLVGGWLLSECFSVQNGVWVRTCGPGIPPQSDGKLYSTRTRNLSDVTVTGYFNTPEQACQKSIEMSQQVYGETGYTFTVVRDARHAGSTDCDFKYNPAAPNQVQRYEVRQTENVACPVGWYQTTNGCVQTVPAIPVTQTEFEDKLANKAMPTGLPTEIGGDYPVGMPQLPSVTTIPMGSPTAIPGTDPIQYQQPAIEVRPASTTDSPWRVDVKPVTVPVSDATGLTQPTTSTTTGAGGVADPDFCALHPTSPACAELGSLDPVDIPNQDINLSITPDTGWGPSSASCPAPKTVTVQGKTLSFSLQMICDTATMIRPFFIGFAWITAVMLFSGMARKE